MLEQHDALAARLGAFRQGEKNSQVRLKVVYKTRQGIDCISKSDLKLDKKNWPVDALKTKIKNDDQTTFEVELAMCAPVGAAWLAMEKEEA